MKFKIEIWHSTTEFEVIEIKAIDALYATKFARWMYPTATKINVKQVKQETLEESAKRLVNRPYGNVVSKSSFIEGAKWQQELICKSEVIQKIRNSKSDAEARRIIRTL